MSSPSDQDSKKFSGFDIPRQNWFRMPNNWTDITADINTIAELKVVEYILKHTWGYQEYGIRKRISTDEFMHGRKRKEGARIDKGTGLSKQSVITGLQKAVERGLLVEEVDDRDRARIKKYYSLRMKQNPDTELSKSEDPPPEDDLDVKSLDPGVKSLDPDVKSLDIGGEEFRHRTKKDTLERQQQKDTNSNNTRETSTSEVEGDVVVALMDRGIGKQVAKGLARDFNPDYLKEKIEFHDYLQAERPKTMKRPAAWLRKACEDDYAAPDGFVSSADRQRLAEEEEWRNEALVAAQEQRLEQEEARRIAQKAEKEAERRKLQEQFGTTKADAELWNQVVGDLKYRLTEATYATYVKGTMLLRSAGGQVIIGVPHNQCREWLMNRLQPTIQKVLQRHLDTDIASIEYITPSEIDGGERAPVPNHS